MSATLVAGTSVRITITYEVADVLTNPTAATLKLQSPDGTLTTVAEVSMSHPSAGTFTYVAVLDVGGVWIIRAEGTGTAAGVGELRVGVADSGITS